MGGREREREPLKDKIKYTQYKKQRDRLPVIYQITLQKEKDKDKKEKRVMVIRAASKQRIE